ncbi:hypothetical protein [Calothrix sp. PCC 7507]|uniref:hypothetical protein n=1 Tax=Calothrix sp. PCC 7507 TaxID=99598 RepID=UPI00191710D9|nr:hypothetical protein [Calothrix sp. PCC 7507]
MNIDATGERCARFGWVEERNPTFLGDVSTPVRARQCRSPTASDIILCRLGIKLKISSQGFECMGAEGDIRCDRVTQLG